MNAGAFVQRRSPSGCYLRLQRDGVWTGVAVEDLTAREFDQIFEQMGPLALRRWVDQLRRAIGPYGERCAARALDGAAAATAKAVLGTGHQVEVRQDLSDLPAAMSKAGLLVREACTRDVLLLRAADFAED